MKFMRTIFVACLLLLAAGAVANGRPNGDIAMNVQALQKECRGKLGVGIVELGLLMQASSNSVFMESGLKSEKRLEALYNLEEQGYVVVVKRQSSNDTYIQFTPTDKGRLIMNSLTSGL